MEKQQPQSQSEGEDEANGDVALRETFAHETHADASRQRHREQPPQRRDADQDGAGRAGETDMGERVAGEGLAAQHQEIADGAGQDRDDRRRGKGVAHEIVVKHGWNAPVRARGPARRRDGDRPVRCDGQPDMTKICPPMRTTSIGAP